MYFDIFDEEYIFDLNNDNIIEESLCEGTDIAYLIETGLIGKFVGNKQFDPRDKGEVLAYNRHHSLFGNIFAPSLFSFIHSERISDKPLKLYPRYINWCAKNEVKPASKEEFAKLTSTYQELRRDDKGIETILDIIGLAPISLGHALVKTGDRNEYALNKIKIKK